MARTPRLDGAHGRQRAEPLPAALEDVSCYPALVAELIERGWSERDLAALARDNIVRVLADAARA